MKVKNNMTILDGKSYRDELLKEYKSTIEKENLKIRLDIIQIGDNKESDVYVRNKIKYSKEIGINPVLHHLDENVSEKDLKHLIDELNRNKEVTGIILQSPIPKHLDFEKMANLIDSKKDIDGFTTKNIDNLYHNKETLIPCTVKGIIKLLEHYGIDLDGKRIVIIGRGEIVGKPLALALTNRNATVTLCHSHTSDLSEYTKATDIIISAVGKPRLIKSDMVKNDSIGIDVGISVIDGKMYGDFDYENIKDKMSYITPVPGGVGPMTVAMIMENLIIAKKMEK